MFYFSELVNRVVVNDNNKPLGKLKDLLFLAEEIPTITKLYVRKNKKKSFAIPIKDIKEINGRIVVNRDFVEKDIAEREFSLAKNLLNRQIIDVKGGKVVRVNDIAIQDKEEGAEYYIAGVDVGFRAILRWFKLEKPTIPLYKLLNLYSRPNFLSWGDIEPLELARGTVQLKKGVADLERMRPEDLADYLEKTNIRNMNKIISGLDEEYAANVIEDLNVNYQTALFKRFQPEQASKLIEALEPDEAVDILLTLPREKRIEILDSLGARKRNELKDLIKYSRTSVGKLINSEFISINSEITASEALSIVREKLPEHPFASYIYVMNNENLLVGVFPLSNLLLHEGDEPVFKFMEQDVIVVHLTTPKTIALKRMLKYRLYALPVIVDSKRMIGVVTFDDMMEEIEEKL
ncbi:MAG: CBS domain-containing protein [Candidatus Levybacteria bacterium]|nr:CBS domain-containing protein [Candidatus Levybacteria bacterium]